MSLAKLTPTKHVTNYMFGTTRNILLGTSLAYAIQNKYYLHIPIIIIMPSVYAGYHIYENKNDIKDWIFK